MFVLRINTQFCNRHTTAMSKLFAHSLSRPRASCARPLVSISETATSSMTDMPTSSSREPPRFDFTLLAAPVLVAAPPDDAPSSPLPRGRDRWRQEHCRQLAPESRLANQHASSSSSTSTLRTDTPSTQPATLQPATLQLCRRLMPPLILQNTTTL